LRAWIDGFKDKTTREVSVKWIGWEYIWPNFTISKKQPVTQAPSDLALEVTHDNPAMNSKLEGLSYDWRFPADVIGKKNAGSNTRASAQVVYAGNYTILVTIKDTRGHETVLSQPVSATAAAPYDATLTINKSNIYLRPPLTVSVRANYFGGHPLDALISQNWTLDGVPVADFANRIYMTRIITQPGSHVVTYTLNSKMGKTVSFDSTINVVANKIPVCTLTEKDTSHVIYVEARCTDADGRVIDYSWEVDGQPLTLKSYRISFPVTGSPKSSTVTITGTDDSKELSIPVSLNVIY
jgi:hypothetical protein